MKKYLLLAAILFVVAYTACNKKSDTPSLNYTVNGLTDVTLRQYADTSFDVVLAIAFLSGTQEPITLTPTGLPAGVTVSPTTFTGTPTFTTTFSFHANVATAGTFPITITGTSPGSGTKTFKFNLIVSPGVPFTYTVSTIADISVPQYSKITSHLPVTVTYGQGIADTVVFEGDGLQSKVKVTPISGVPTFSSSIPVQTAFSIVGTYPVSIKHKSTSTAAQTATFNVTVTPNPTCSTSIAGNYTSVTNCSNPINYYWDSTYTVTSAVSPYSGGQLQIPCIATLTATLDCSAGTLTTLQRSFGGGDYNIHAGTGTFSADTIIVHYDVYDYIGGGTYRGSCTSVLSR